MVEELLDENPHMIVVKSISKSYGIPGLRLGVAASGDTDLIGQLKKDVAIWNINSFGEFYMQIEEKYRKDYAASLNKLRAERTRFAEKLIKLTGIRIFQSQANYLMVELTGNGSKVDAFLELLEGYEILELARTGITGLQRGIKDVTVIDQEGNINTL